MADAARAYEIEADSDDALMARICARDAAVFRSVVERHVGQLHRIAYRLINDASEAEDLAQEALLRLWRDAERWRPGISGIGAWLHRVVVNLCLDRLRKRRFSSDAAVPERADETPLAPVALDAERQRALAVAAIAALLDRQRAAIVLTYYEDLPNQRAAQTMDMNLKAFESLLLRARNALRAALAETREVSS